VGNRELRRLSDALLDAYIAAHPAPRKVIVLDMDATDDPKDLDQALRGLPQSPSPRLEILDKKIPDDWAIGD